MTHLDYYITVGWLQLTEPSEEKEGNPEKGTVKKPKGFPKVLHSKKLWLKIVEIEWAPLKKTKEDAVRPKRRLWTYCFKRTFRDQRVLMQKKRKNQNLVRRLFGATRDECDSSHK